MSLFSVVRIRAATRQRAPRWGRLLALLCTLCHGSGAFAGTLSDVDANAHYPEAPAWRDGQLYFVEYSTGNIKRWDGQQTSIFWHRDACGPSGLIEFHGHWLVACYDDNSIVEIDATGAVIRVSRKDRRGRPFTGPNDFTGDGRGGIYFSASGVYDINAPITGTVMHIAADGRTIAEVANTLHYPNGLTLSRNGRHLLVAEMLAGRILSFLVKGDGTLGPRRVWARLQDIVPPGPSDGPYTGPDGLKLGPDGNYYIAQNGSGQVIVVGDDKQLVQSIRVETPFVTNLAFGAPGTGTVFITGAFDQWKAPYPGAVYQWRP